MPYIFIVAGEISGDNLAAGLIKQLRSQHKSLTIKGVAGPAMREAGCEQVVPIDELSVMGLVEVLQELPRLYKLRQRLVTMLLREKPDLFIGVDAPDFNLGLARKLKQAGIRTIHYTSPSVWAWRKNRIYGIAKAVDLMLCLFPFEQAIYQANSIAVQYVGHPLADLIPLAIDKTKARVELGLPQGSGSLIALLPGSRQQEIQRMGPLLLQVAAWCQQRCPQLSFIIPLAKAEYQPLLQRWQQQWAPNITCHYLLGQATAVLMAADAAVVTSGTATLEAMLCKCPMVVAYKMSALTYQLAKRIVDTPYIALPNLLAGYKLVPEFIQAEANVMSLAQAILVQVTLPMEQKQELLARFSQLHTQLALHASVEAAKAVLHALERAPECLLSP